MLEQNLILLERPHFEAEQQLTLLELTLLDRVRHLEAEQPLMAQALNELRWRKDIIDKQMPAETGLAEHLANWSRKGLNLRPPVSAR